MQIEYEATFPSINKNELREKLTAAGAELKKPEFLQKRMVFNLPEGCQIKNGWLRVRDEGDKITLSLKSVEGNKISDQKEICLTIDSFENAVQFLENLNCQYKAYQETKRELWLFKGTEITIDEWPYLEPLLEVEGPSEEIVKSACSDLDLNYQAARFCSVDVLYSEKYKFKVDFLNFHVDRLTFNDPSPFENITADFKN